MLCTSVDRLKDVGFKERDRDMFLDGTNRNLVSKPYSGEKTQEWALLPASNASVYIKNLGTE